MNLTLLLFIAVLLLLPICMGLAICLMRCMRMNHKLKEDNDWLNSEMSNHYKNKELKQ